MMDTDGDNRISHEEFDAHFENLGVEPNQALFTRDDTNENGFIEFDEFGGNKGGGSTNLFAQLDANQDNRLSREEFTIEWHTAPIELFENDDQDGDGFVSFDEFGGPKGLGDAGAQESQGDAGEGEEQEQNMFALLDADNDGRISREEFTAEWHQVPDPDGLWEQEDQDGDGFIQYEEFSGPKGDPPPQEAEEQDDVFSVLDQDQDGRVSREEFVAGFDGPENEPEGLWDQEDSNHDGYISWDEFGGPKSSQPPRREL
jgi:Ca2+-binding EF-hand superfamily protein